MLDEVRIVQAFLHGRGHEVNISDITGALAAVRNSQSIEKEVNSLIAQIEETKRAKDLEVECLEKRIKALRDQCSHILRSQKRGFVNLVCEACGKSIPGT